MPDCVLPFDDSNVIQWHGNDLRIPPGNRLEKLVGDRAGQYSIRSNDQWRICFVWNLQTQYDLRQAQEENADIYHHILPIQLAQ